MNVERKRRAVFTVLSEILSDDELWSAMWCWQQQFAEKSQFELNGFLSACAHLDVIAKNRANIYRALINSMMLGERELKPDPIAHMQRYAAADDSGLMSVNSTPQQEDWSEVFSLTLAEVFSQLRRDHAQVVGKYAQEQAVRKGLNSELTYAFTLWIDRRGMITSPTATLRDIRKLLNYLYIGLCESLGPVEADRILSLSVAAVKSQKSTPDVGRLL